MGKAADGAAAGFAKLHDHFVVGAQYFSAMDCAIYLKEDCSYRAARVSPTLSLLLAPDDDRVVGVKIKGVSHLAEQFFSILEEDGRKLDEANRVELRQLLRMAFLSDTFTERAMGEAEAQRRTQMSARAKEFLSKEAGNFSIELPIKMAA